MDYLTKKDKQRMIKLHKAPELGDLLVKSLPRSAGREEWWCENGGVCFGFNGGGALRIFFANPKDQSVYHVDDFDYTNLGLAEQGWLAFTLVGSRIYVVGGGFRDVAAHVYYCDLENQPPTGGKYEWKAGPKMKSHKHDPLVISFAGSLYVLSLIKCKCVPFEVLHKGADEWVSLKFPNLKLFTAYDTRYCSGSYVFEEGKKILVLLSDPAESTHTLWIYDVDLNVWDHKDVFSPDYTFPVKDLDLLHPNNNSFVINGSSFGDDKEALLGPLGLTNVLPLPKANKYGVVPSYPYCWHLLRLRDTRFCALLVYAHRILDQDVGFVSRARVGFGTFDLVEVEPPPSGQKPHQYEIGKLKKITFTDIAIGPDQQTSSSSTAKGGITVDSGSVSSRRKIVPELFPLSTKLC